MGGRNDSKNPLLAFDVLLYSLNPSCCAYRRPFLHKFQGSIPAVTVHNCCLCHHPPAGQSSAQRSALWDESVPRLKEFSALELFWLRLLADQHAEVLCI